MGTLYTTGEFVVTEGDAGSNGGMGRVVFSVRFADELVSCSAVEGSQNRFTIKVRSGHDGEKEREIELRQPKAREPSAWRAGLPDGGPSAFQWIGAFLHGNHLGRRNTNPAGLEAEYTAYQCHEESNEGNT